VAVALAAGLALLALALGLVLSGSALVVAGTNSIPAAQTLGYSKGGNLGCAKSGTLPRGTSAIRLSLGSNLGPTVSLKVLSGSRVITDGSRGAGWGIAETVTVPVRPLPHPVPEVSICVTLGPVVEHLEVKGAVVRAILPGGGQHLAERFRVEYLRPGHASWFSRLSSVADRMGLGHAASGTWVVFVELALMIAVAILSIRLVLRAANGRGRALATDADRSPRRLVRAPRSLRLPSWSGRLQARSQRLLATGRRVPRAAWLCALIAALNAACWSLITPPFQVPDEPSHFAYVQWLAESASLPTSATGAFSEEEQVALADLHHAEVRFWPEREPIVAQGEQSRLEQDLSRPLDRKGHGVAGVAASQPPLYYALEAVPYFLGTGGTILDRLELMRLLSALFAGLTALFGYLFVREVLPRVRWAWSVGGLSIALMPLLGFMSGAVNADAMVFAVSAAAFFCVARGFRRGLTPRRAVAIGAVTALGSLTKLNFIGLVPGLLLALIVLALRERRTSSRRAYRSLALGLGIAAIPGFVYILLNLARHHPVLGSASQLLHPTGGHGSLLDELDYIWQFYLPKLPGTATDFPGLAPWRVIWFDRSIGLYGWLDTQFPSWVYDVAVIPVALLVLLAIRALAKSGAAMWRRRGELLVYAVIAAGLIALTGAASYLEFPGQAGRYGEPRYLLPLIPLMGAALALSARGAGRRLGPPVAALIVVLFLGWDLFSQLQVIARYYG
jgi:Predicted membrane protein (DUF2142)